MICNYCNSEIAADDSAIHLHNTRYRAKACDMHMSCFGEYSRWRAQVDREANERLLAGQPLSLDQVAYLIGCPKRYLQDRLRRFGLLRRNGRWNVPGDGWGHLFEMKQRVFSDPDLGTEVKYEVPFLLAEWYPLVVKVWSEGGR